MLYEICKMICEGKERKSTCSGCIGEPGQSPAPSPLLRHVEPVGGRGEEWWAGSCLGILSGERGFSLASQFRELESHLILASKNRGLESHLGLASCFGGLFWQAFQAHQFGGVLWQVNLAIIQWVFGIRLKPRKEE